MTYRVSIITVSDTAFADTSKDLSGPAIKAHLSDSAHNGKFIIENPQIVPDDEVLIRDKVNSIVKNDKPDLLLTTGGTGFSSRDRTPEAISPLIDRPAPGIIHLLMTDSLKHTRLASLSRPVAGIITGTNTFVVTLPGSPKAVKENLTSLLGVIDHALDLLQGGRGERVHQQLGVSDRQSLVTSSGVKEVKGITGIHQQQHHHHHHHHHDGHVVPTPRTEHLSHDPSKPVSSRNRVSPWPLVPFENAVSLVLQHCKPLDTITHLVNNKLPGHVVAEDVFAPQNVPYTKTSNVDGYALSSSFRPAVYDVVTPSSHSIHQRLPIDSIMRINTGAPLPYGTDAVIMVEDTKLVQTDEDGEETEVETLAAVSAGENVRDPGSDVMMGEKVCEIGEIIGSGGGEIGTLVFVGRKEVKVHRKPVVAILSTGTELIDITSDAPSMQSAGPNSSRRSSSRPSQNASARSSAVPSRRPSFNPLLTAGAAFAHPTKPSPLATSATEEPQGEQWTGVWDTNRPSLAAALEGLSYEVIDLGIVADTLDAHVNALREGLDKADLILTTGGSSMGSTDLLKPIIERHLGGTIHFGRVAIKPGKPTSFATVPYIPPQSDHSSDAETDLEPPNTASTAQPTFNGQTGQIPHKKAIFALPGNPASALVMFWQFVVPALRRLGGWPKERCKLPHVSVRINEDVWLDPRPEFHRVMIRWTGTGLAAFSTGGQRSSRVASLAGANGLLALPAKTQGGKSKLEKGSQVDAVIIGELQM